MRTIAIIPARYASSRFPGKPLADMEGKPVIEWVYEGITGTGVVDEVLVATDDERIAKAVNDFGGNYIMTRSNHRSGTERCCEAMEKLAATGKMYDVVINVQGDEPFVDKKQIATLTETFTNGTTQIATLAKKIESSDELFSPNNVKVVIDKQGKALLFSRQSLPYQRDIEPAQWVTTHTYYKHIGIYAYRSEVLSQIARLEEEPIELCEKLEQLRWMANGYRIDVRITDCENIGIDTPEDLAVAKEYLKKKRENN